MTALSSCRAAVLPAPVQGRDRIAPRSSGNPEQRNAPRGEGKNRVGALQTPINLAIAVMTIVAVGAFYGLLMLGMSQIATAAHLSPYAAFYAAGQNPWAQIVTGRGNTGATAPAGVTVADPSH